MLTSLAYTWAILSPAAADPQRTVPLRYPESLARYGHLLLLLSLAILFAADHLAWIASSPLPMIGADSPVHAQRMVATWFWMIDRPQLSHGSA